MAYGVKLEDTFTLDQAKKAIYDTNGMISRAAKSLGVCTRAFYDYVDVQALWEDVERARAAQREELDDLALDAVERLTQELKREPAVALRAAHITLTRRGGTRKDWVPKESNGEGEGDKSDALDLFRQWIISKRGETTSSSSSTRSEESET